MNLLGKVLEEKPSKGLALWLSVSKAKTYSQCASKFRWTYLEKLPRKEFSFQSFGKFIHQILELFCQALMDDPKRSYHELMKECWGTSMKSWGHKLSTDERNECKTIMQSYLKNLAELEKNNDLPTILDVEKEFYIDIDSEVVLNGFIDLIQQDSDGVLHVADYKTSKTAKYLKSDQFQLLTYCYVMLLNDPSLELIRASYVMCRLDFQYITKKYTQKDIMAVEAQLLSYAKQIKEEKLYRPATSPLCRFCDALEVCEEGKLYIQSKDQPTNFKKDSREKSFGESSW